MDGFLDELNQAFVTIDFGQGPLDFQIDTGFCGTLVIGEELFDPTHAEPAGTVEAELAAGQIYVYPSFVTRSRWLGMDAEIEILVGPGPSIDARGAPAGEVVCVVSKLCSMRSSSKNFPCAINKADAL